MKILGRFTKTELEYDAKVDNPDLALAEVADECQTKGNLVSIDINNKPTYIYRGSVFCCKKDDPFPALNAYPMSSTDTLGTTENWVEEIMKKRIDLFREQFPELLIFGKIAREWVKV